jgi:hemerythrin-like domain-containing protein
LPRSGPGTSVLPPRVAATLREGETMSTDAIVVLKDDHKRVKALFREFEAAHDGPASRKASLVRQILSELTVHTYLENEVMYPEIRRLLPDLDEDILESYEEHHVADVLCLELSTMDPEDEHFDAKVSGLIESVSHHIDEEEQEWFPKVRENLGRNQLREIGARMQELRPNAPTKPSEPKALTKALDAMRA